MSFHRTALFDLDGTIIDSRPGIFRCVRAMLSDMGRGNISDAELMPVIGPPLSEGLSMLLHTDEPAVLDAAVKSYRIYYAAGGMFEAVLYPGIEQALKDCASQGRELYLVTSKAQPYSGQIIGHFGLDKYFRGIYAPGLAQTYAGKAELISAALTENSVDPADAVMIGDRQYDMTGAVSTRVCAAGALWGFGSREELLSAGADILMSSPEDIVRMI
ncbi:MAG: HAD hydrolase-like protein [Spirochaetota bacterium]